MVTLKEIQKKYKKSKQKSKKIKQSLHKRKSLCLILEELFIEVFVEQPLALPWTNTMSIIDRQEIRQEWKAMARRHLRRRNKFMKIFLYMEYMLPKGMDIKDLVEIVIWDTITDLNLFLKYL